MSAISGVQSNFSSARVNAESAEFDRTANRLRAQIIEAQKTMGNGDRAKLYNSWLSDAVTMEYISSKPALMKELQKDEVFNQLAGGGEPEQKVKVARISINKMIENLNQYTQVNGQSLKKENNSGPHLSKDGTIYMPPPKKPASSGGSAGRPVVRA